MRGRGDVVSETARRARSSVRRTGAAVMVEDASSALTKEWRVARTVAARTSFADIIEEMGRG